MAIDPTKLDDLEMLSLIAHGLIPYMERVEVGEKDPFPYPDALLRGFNQLILTCALHDVPRAERPTSIPKFVATWAILPLTEWTVKPNTVRLRFVIANVLDKTTRIVAFQHLTSLSF